MDYNQRLPGQMDLSWIREQYRNRLQAPRRNRTMDYNQRLLEQMERSRIREEYRNRVRAMREDRNTRGRWNADHSQFIYRAPGQSLESFNKFMAGTAELMAANPELAEQYRAMNEQAGRLVDSSAYMRGPALTNSRASQVFTPEGEDGVPHLREEYGRRYRATTADDPMFATLAGAAKALAEQRDREREDARRSGDRTHEMEMLRMQAEMADKRAQYGADPRTLAALRVLNAGDTPVSQSIQDMATGDTPDTRTARERDTRQYEAEQAYGPLVAAVQDAQTQYDRAKAAYMAAPDTNTQQALIAAQQNLQHAETAALAGARAARQVFTPSGKASEAVEAIPATFQEAKANFPRLATRISAIEAQITPMISNLLREIAPEIGGTLFTLNSTYARYARDARRKIYAATERALLEAGLPPEWANQLAQSLVVNTIDKVWTGEDNTERRIQRAELTQPTIGGY